jgi:hypothetical protein
MKFNLRIIKMSKQKYMRSLKELVILKEREKKRRFSPIKFKI